jgi:hypothetical protein
MRKIIQAALLCGVMFPAWAAEPVKSVVIPKEIAYSNKDAIDSAIVAECALPQRTAELLTKALTAAGIEHKSVDKAGPKSGANVLELEILQATSGGNAFVGHYKSVTVMGKLYQQGKQVGNFTAHRRSGGGAFGGFKGSCAVLGRCAEVIGQDIAKWLAAPTEGAKLGDAK